MANKYRVNGELVSADEYNKSKYEDLRVRVQRGQKEAIKAHAEAHGHGSINSFINEAIAEKMAREKERE